MRRTAMLCTLQLSLMGGTAFAQSAGEVISGTVSDSFGPIMMANVVEIDKSNRIVSSAQTDMNGNFSFKIKDPKNKIRFSYVGCKTKTMPIEGTTYNVVLEDKTALSEVTVVSKRRGNGSGLAIPQDELSTSNQTINTKEFEGLAITTIDEALQGRIAGLDIIANSGNLGAGTSMRLRGVSSINASSEPLIVVDGNVWENDLGNSIDFSSANDEKFAELLNVNPEDIESISVLKDAAATAIWGSQGANGVIEIKTKRGARGNTKVTYSYRLTGTWQPKGYQMLSGDEYTMLMKEAYFNPKLSSDASNIIEFNYDTSNKNGWNNYNKNTDWVDAVQQTGWRQNHYISLTGGGEKANFRIGAGYDHETGSIIKQQLDRLSSRVALDYFVSNRIKIVTNLSFTYTKNDQNYADLLGMAYRRMPNTPIYEYDSDNNNTGYYYRIPTTVSTELQDMVDMTDNSGSRWNPVALANLATKKETTYKISPEFKIEYNLLGVDEGKSQLKYEGKIVFDIFNKYNDSFLPAELNVKTWSDTNVNKSTADSYKSLGITTTHTLTFTPHFKNEDHSMMMMLRGQLTDGSSTSQATGVYGLPTGSIISTGAAGIIDGGKFSSSAGQWRSMYFTYSMHYAYKGRYMFDFSVRRDGSTKFGPDNRWGTFPAVSLRWNVSREPWMQSVSKWLSMLSVRPGWGMVGQQPGAEYLYFSKYSNGKGYLGETSTAPANVQLSKLKWETKKTWNLGFDFGFFNDKVTGNLELYKQYTSDLLMRDRKIPTSSGYTQLAYDNIGKMENSGWEFNVNTNNLVKAGKLGIDFNVTFANNKNVITEMEESCLELLSGEFNRQNGSYITRVELDKPFGSIYGFRYKGTYQYSDYSDTEVPGVSGPDAPVVRDVNGTVIKDNKGRTKPMTFCYGTTSEYEFKGGDAVYEDINHDGTINELDIVYLGSSLPKFTGGFGVKFKWGRWSWNNQFNFRYGNKVINGNRMNSEAMYGNNNQSRAVNHRWRVEGDIAEIPRALHRAGYNYLGSDRFVEDGSFLRLNYTQVSYSFAPKLIKKYGLSQLSFYVSANNVFCITKYSGADPEVSYGGYGIVTDNAQTPRAKSVTGGITVQF